MKIFESVPIKNIQKQIKLCLKDEVEYREGQVVSKTLAQNRNVSLTLFAFEKGEEISTHSSGGDALVTVLDGKGRFTIDGEIYYLCEGESIVMPRNVPHAVSGRRYGITQERRIPQTLFTSPLAA